MAKQQIPFCFLPDNILEALFPSFQSIGDFLDSTMFPNFSLTLRQGRVDMHSKKYLTYSFISDFFLAIITFFIAFALFIKFNTKSFNPLVMGIVFAILIFFFLFIQQMGFPQIVIKKRVDDINKNILPALQNVLVQLKSGVPLFDVSVNVAASDYGEVSKEFMTLVRKINGGMHQVEAFEAMALENPSTLFRSSIWQLVNGMKTGSELSEVLKNIMVNLAEEEVLQIEQYGAQLSPLTMFYMIGAVILPALGINFLIIISAFMNLDQGAAKMVFWGAYGFILFFQFIFLGIIKQKRPSILDR